MKFSIFNFQFSIIVRLVCIIGLMVVMGTTALAQGPRQACGPQPDGYYILCAKIPGLEGPIYGIADLVRRFFIFAVGLGGAVAFVMVAINGLKYMLEGGNIIRQSEAVKGIWSAVLGLILLLGATAVLFNINPALVEIKEAVVPDVKPTRGRITDVFAFTGEGEKIYLVNQSQIESFKQQATQKKSNIEARKQEMNLLDRGISDAIRSRKFATEDELRKQKLLKRRELEELNLSLWQLKANVGEQLIQDVKEAVRAGHSNIELYTQNALEFVGLEDFVFRQYGGEGIYKYRDHAREEAKKSRQRLQILNQNAANPNLWLRRLKRLPSLKRLEDPELFDFSDYY